jgi:ubiquinone/menaquinone biosynthesis C-methylase UbiE
MYEPEVMDTALDALDYDQMDHADVNRRFVADFLRALADAGISEEMEVLDLGTGTAQIPIELCRQNAKLRVVAIDLSVEMLKLATKNVASAGLADRIRLELVDAKQLPFADGAFSAVVSNSIVHHIPAPEHPLAEAVRVTRPGGLLFIRDLARPRDDFSVARLVRMYAADCNEHQRQLFDDSLRAALSVGEIRSIVSHLGFDRQSVLATSDRHWTWSAVK